MSFFPRASLTVLLLALLVLNLAGCANPEVESSPVPTATPGTAQELTFEGYKPRLKGKAVVEMVINGAPVTIEVDGDQAPITGGNFVDLVQRGVYNGLVFHRVVKSPQPFVAQGGDPKGDGTGGFVDPQTQKPRNIPLEIKLTDADPQQKTAPVYGTPLGQQAGYSAPPVALPHRRGAVAMARSQSPNSASSQFYFGLSDDIGFLDGDYAVFGYVTKGMETVEAIKQGDKIQSAKVVSGAENLVK